MSLAIIIMAAGKGTRMKSDLAKVLHRVNGRPVIEYVLEKSTALVPDKIVLIVGHQADKVKEATANFPVEWALQEPQLGTGHAVIQAEEHLHSFPGDILILSGDAPLVSISTLKDFIDNHRTENAAATVLTAHLENPSGYGRIIRHKDSNTVSRIVEHKDATPEELLVKEINSGVYVFKADVLFRSLHQITNDNAQQEYYLTDVFSVCFGNGEKVCALQTENADEIKGINTVEQLKEAEKLLLHGSYSS
ncbi:sugar phosphate nucleotidyltransferase [Prosthecochloris sp. SCSIO W1101]|uniref:sugar phosphate nucleotidyltransferase n=1 Tax=Prosthecochloris sp. SCSIO W1101 TaxID=2992242 RepID=UPI00223E685A|nr:sugar phosphate nucleotidyltransferase [Prosthecochloris sp. SCSIO W1101]UZJ41075.1 sugar phosphate nucleotidyltransferase [Prosthecochloris sp. SCSIO W1101]